MSEGATNGLPERIPAAQRHRLREAPANQPPARPMLAVLSDRRAFGDKWIFERKLDGVRVLATRDQDRMRLSSRSGQRLDVTYPEIGEALAAQNPTDFVLDGEIVAMRDGRTDFALLQQRMQLTNPRAVLASRVAVIYYVFDLLRLDGWDTTRLPLRLRKSLLRENLHFRSPLRFTPHRNHSSADPEDLLADACARGWEGLIAKRADARYQPQRSADWLKLKCTAGQEFVVVGFTEPAGSRAGFGALLLAYHDDDRALRYAGKVGTGYDHAALLDIRSRLEPLRQPQSPLGRAQARRERGAHWTRPELVAQIGFTEWTRDGMLRHPRFLGLREDKNPSEVVRETPAPGGSSR